MKPQGIPNHVSRFKQLSDAICSIANRHSVRLKGYHDSSLPHFSRLTPGKQSLVLNDLDVYLQTMLLADRDDELNDRPERALWHALSVLQLIPPSDLFGKLKPTDIVEIYDLDGFQVWRNFEFLRVCSYTLEEVYSIEWHRRYQRPEEKSAECMQKLQALLSFQTPEIYDANISTHVLKETMSEERFEIHASHDWIARLRDRTGNCTAFLAVSTGKVANARVD